jgi:hypothetical protein
MHVFAAVKLRTHESHHLLSEGGLISCRNVLHFKKTVLTADRQLTDS